MKAEICRITRPKCALDRRSTYVCVFVDSRDKSLNVIQNINGFHLQNFCRIRVQIPLTNFLSVHFTNSNADSATSQSGQFFWIPQLKADSAYLSGFRKCIRIPPTICGFNIQFANPLTIWGFRLVTADSTNICALHDCLILLNTYNNICFFNSLTVPGSANFVTVCTNFCCAFREVACFWNNFEYHSVLDNFPPNPKQRRGSTNSKVADTATLLLLSFCWISL